MKTLIKKIIGSLIRIEPFRKFLDGNLAMATGYIQVQLDQYRPKKTNRPVEILSGIYPDKKVKRGPFAGLVYPAYEAVGAAMPPKFIGTYEDELHPFFNEILTSGYSDVVDIGAAEGYYVCGLALKDPNLNSYAYDTDPYARARCSRMAEVNGIADRVHVREFCDSKELEKFAGCRKLLVISDCEGYEAELFNKDVVMKLSSSTFMIEIHEFLNSRIPEIMTDAFSATHDIEVVMAENDTSKVLNRRFPELERFSDAERFDLIREGRPQMQWWIARPRREEEV